MFVHLALLECDTLHRELVPRLVRLVEHLLKRGTGWEAPALRGHHIGGRERHESMKSVGLG
jgi:hypothetical protein